MEDAYVDDEVYRTLLSDRDHDDDWFEHYAASVVQRCPECHTTEFDHDELCSYGV